MKILNRNIPAWIPYLLERKFPTVYLTRRKSTSFLYQNDNSATDTSYHPSPLPSPHPNIKHENKFVSNRRSGSGGICKHEPCRFLKCIFCIFFQNVISNIIASFFRLVALSFVRPFVLSCTSENNDWCVQLEWK